MQQHARVTALFVLMHLCWVHSVKKGKENNMHYDTKACGLRLKELRQKHSMTQEELSDKLNISLSMMSKIETGNKRLNLHRSD